MADECAEPCYIETHDGTIPRVPGVQDRRWQWSEGRRRQGQGHGQLKMDSPSMELLVLPRLEPRPSQLVRGVWHASSGCGAPQRESDAGIEAIQGQRKGQRQEGRQKLWSWTDGRWRYSTSGSSRDSHRRSGRSGSTRRSSSASPKSPCHHESHTSTSHGEPQAVPTASTEARSQDCGRGGTSKGERGLPSRPACEGSRAGSRRSGKRRFSTSWKRPRKSTPKPAETRQQAKRPRWTSWKPE